MFADMETLIQAYGDRVAFFHVAHTIRDWTHGGVHPGMPLLRGEDPGAQVH